MGCKRLPPSKRVIYVLFLLFFASDSLVSSGLDNLVYNKLCVENGTDIQLCTNNTFTQLHDHIQARSASWVSYISLASLFPAVLSNIILSSHCDLKGHRLSLLLPCIGVILSSLLIGLCSLPQFMDWPISVLFLHGFLYGLFGTGAMVTMAGYSYQVLISKEEERVMTIILTAASQGIGQLIATAINGPIISSSAEYGITYLYGLALCCGLITLTLTLSMTDLGHEKSGSDDLTLRDILGLTRIKESALSMFKKREGKVRMLVHLSVSVTFTMQLAVKSRDIGFLYYVKEGNFTLSSFSLYNAVSGSVQAVGGAFTLWFLSGKLKIAGLNVLLVSCTVSALGFIVISQSPDASLAWVGTALFTMQSLPTIIMQVVQAKLLPQDVAKLYAYQAVLLLLLNNIAPFLYKSFYAVSVSVWPGASLAVGGLVNVISLMLSMILTEIRTKEEYSPPKAASLQYDDSEGDLRTLKSPGT